MSAETKDVWLLCKTGEQLNKRQIINPLEKAAWWLNTALTVRKPSSVNVVLFFCIPIICFLSFHLLCPHQSKSFGYLCFKPRHIRTPWHTCVCTQLGWIPDWVVLKLMLQSKHTCTGFCYRTGSCSYFKSQLSRHPAVFTFTSWNRFLINPFWLCDL